MGRLPHIDWAKGVAILGVLLIHARPLADTAFHVHVIDRAVLVFLTLFGVTSELWWRRENGTWVEKTTRWYRTRALRLLVPVWATLAVLWAIRFGVGRSVETPTRVLLTFAGYMPWVGTGWFVTLAVELVLLFPLLRWVSDVVGTRFCLAGTAVALVVSERRMFDAISLVRTIAHDRSPHLGGSLFYYYWIFPPAGLFLAAAGMLLADSRAIVSAGATAAAIGLFLVGVAFQHALGGDWMMQHLVLTTLAVPLTIAILGIVRLVAFAPRLAAALAWLGRHSWGVYLGQLLVHETAYLYINVADEAPVIRWFYFTALLLGAVVLVHLGERARSWAAETIRNR